MNLYANIDEAYIDLVTKLNRQQIKLDPKRAGVTRKSLPFVSLNIDVSKRVPLISCKRAFVESAVKEFNFMVNGCTNISDLNASFWNIDAYNYFKRLVSSNNLDQEYVLSFDLFKTVLGTTCNYIPDYKYGDIGNVYGALWEEQLPYVIKQLNSSAFHTDMLVFNSDYRIKNNPLKRALEPCHYSWQIVATNNGFGLILNMRSNDVFLGLPMNVLFYYLLGKYIESQITTGLKFTNLFLNLANPHLYSNCYDEAIELVKGFKKNDTEYVLDSDFKFIKSDRIKCVFSSSIFYQEYKETIKHVPIAMIGQSNELL